MKKIGKVLSLAMTIMVMASLIGCGGRGENKHSDKTWLYVGVYDGGVGTQWVKNLAAEFETKYANESFEEGKEGVHIEPVPKKLPYERDTLIANIKAGNETSDIYYTASPDNYEFYRSGVCADITEAVNEKVYSEAGEYVGANGTKSIIDKTATNYVESFKQSNGKYYSLPFEDSVVGFVYDHDLFIARGWLHQNAEKEVIDYPQTVNEFFDLLDKIVKSGVIPFTYSPSDADFYTSSIFNALVQMYEGENSKLLYNYGGESGTEYTFAKDTFTPSEVTEANITVNADGSQTVQITEENAYLLSQMEGRKKAIEFIERLFGSNKKYLDPDLSYISQSFSETQKSFINSSKASQMAGTGKKAIAMIIEGEWWENESRQHFTDMSTAFGSTYAYGARDFRYMPLPKFENQNSEESVIWSFSGGATCFVNANTKNKDLAEKWLQYSLSESALEKFTIQTGCVQAYEFDLTAEQKAQMTPFARNVYEIKRERQDVTVGRTPKKCEFALNNSLAIGEMVKINGMTYQPTFTIFKNNNFTTAEILQGAKNYYNKTDWMTAYNDYKGN